MVVGARRSLESLPDSRADSGGYERAVVLLPGCLARLGHDAKRWTNYMDRGQGFKLASQGDSMTWGSIVLRFLRCSPGASVTFSFNITAPTMPGTYNFSGACCRKVCNASASHK